jgi:ribosome-associated heat shock protein Hsp15
LVYGAGLRIDKYLWYARLAPSRAHAQDLCESRRLRVDGRVVERASALVRAGSVLTWARDSELIVVRVEGLPDRRGPYVEARQYYTDLSPEVATPSHALLPEAFAVA